MSRLAEEKLPNKCSKAPSVKVYENSWQIKWEPNAENGSEISKKTKWEKKKARFSKFFRQKKQLFYKNLGLQDFPEKPRHAQLL